ncbi:MAG: hypothetical protein DMF68_21310 [Acidobacteria bacterium]|nr:MAG: hypothetical protein DMF68_21310 [Acidobacteriota bacterium]
MTKSNQRKSEILGMPFGTACNKLRRMVIFELLRRHQENVCFKCGKVIPNAEDLTLEHKETWLDGGSSLFWDLNNITFSHKQCNLRKGFVRREIVDGSLWCSNCKQYKPVSCFHREKKQRTDYALLCKDCSNSKRKSVKATGNCNNCGAVRGTQAFRRSHNICMRCHNELVRARYVRARAGKSHQAINS